MFYNLRRSIRRNISKLYRISEGENFVPGERYTNSCPCCGASNIIQKDILWDDLVDAWGLSANEVDYINRQQGLRCVTCGARMRSMAIAAWICEHYGFQGTLLEAIRSSAALKEAKVLEINEAGHLTQFFKELPQHTIGCYPDVDMQALPYPDELFDLIVHSDTLEHVPDPVQALRECRRVLKKSGRCVYTVPVIVDRLTRRTDRGLASYHGTAGVAAEDFKVRTEFGADSWKTAINAGFRECSIFSFEFPSALVHVCKR